MFGCGTVVWLISFFCILMFQRSFYTSFHFFYILSDGHGDMVILNVLKEKVLRFHFAHLWMYPPLMDLHAKKRSEPWEFLEALRGHFFVRQI